MKKYQINVNGQKYTVEIDDPTASPASVRVNGKTFAVTLDEQTVASASAPRPAVHDEIVETYVPVVSATFVEVETPEPEATKASTAATSTAGAREVIAPMPGKIMDIVAKVGDRIKNGDVLCNLEAMKMKSPIRSTSDGVVAQVLISEGQNVNYGDVLITLN